MSTDWLAIIATWGFVAVMVFIGASVALNDSSLSDKERAWIGRIGLTAPLWPLTALTAIVVMFVMMGCGLRRAARGSR